MNLEKLVWGKENTDSSVGPCLRLPLALENQPLFMYVEKTTGSHPFGQERLWPEGVKGKSGLVSGLCCPGIARLGRAGQASDSLKFDPAG